MEDRKSTGTTGSRIGAPPDEFEQVVSGAALQDRNLTPFAPGVSISFALPPLTDDGRERLRDLLGSVLPGVETVAAVVRRNADGEITAVSVPVSQMDLSRVQQVVNALPVPNAAPARKGGEGGRGSGFFKTLFTTLGPTVTTLVALVPIFFVIFPRLKPDEPPVELSVDVSDVTIEEWVPGGVVASYRVSFLGYKGKKIQMEWAPFDAATQVRLASFGTLPPPPTNDYEPGIDPITGNAVTYAIKADAKTDQVRERITAYPPSADCIFIRVYAYDDRNPPTRLDYADSPPFNSLDPHADCSQFAATLTPTPAASAVATTVSG